MHITREAATWPSATRFGFAPKIPVTEGPVSDDAEMILVLQGPSVALAASSSLGSHYRFIEVVQGAACPEWRLRNTANERDEIRLPLVAPYYSDSLLPPARQVPAPAAPPTPTAPRRRATRIRAPEPEPTPLVDDTTPTTPSDGPLAAALIDAGLVYIAAQNAWWDPSIVDERELPECIRTLVRPLVVLTPGFDMNRLPYRELTGKIHFVLTQSPVYYSHTDTHWDRLSVPIPQPEIASSTSKLRYDGCYDALLIPMTCTKLPWWAQAIDSYDHTPGSGWLQFKAWPAIRYILQHPTTGETYIFTRPLMGLNSRGTKFYAGAQCWATADNVIRATDGAYVAAGSLQSSHTSCEGSPCWGTAREGMASTDLATRMSTYLAYLTSANMDDGRGSYCTITEMRELLARRRARGVIA